MRASLQGKGSFLSGARVTCTEIHMIVKTPTTNLSEWPNLLDVDLQSMVRAGRYGLKLFTNTIGYVEGTSCEIGIMTSILMWYSHVHMVH